jgi:hypothetical protein
MAVCGVRNDYARAFTITDVDGGQLTFDSFQCAIHRLTGVRLLRLQDHRPR